ncbi:hypothetical protein FRC04_004559 [Tulasnella sp. 424]|nr:hypothetical protein FRC04_004559 [Tulasnella sp. 424]KAG8976628.1 hypothetical protein FRC05_003467 [Tulasnella sp. 425]
METTVTPHTQGAVEFAPHIHRFPVELLQHLLSLAVAEIRHGNRPWHVYSRIVELRLVSTRWLAAIDSHPSLWTLLTNRLSPSLVSIVLEKSGKLPLDVDLCIQSFNTDPPLHYVDIVTSLAERWRSLDIVWHHPEQDEALRNLLLTPAPRLKAVSIVSFDNDVFGTISLFDNMAPDLDSISTRLVLPNWNWFLMKGLRKLAVGEVFPDVRDFEGLVRVLIASPNMEKLEVRRWKVRDGTRPGEPSFKLEPIVLDSLHLFALHGFPLPWADKLLEAIRIPQRCAVDIELNLDPSSQPPLSKRMEQLQARIAGSSLLKVVFLTDEGISYAKYICHGTDGVGDTSISLQYAERHLQPSGDFQLWLSSLAEITESVQTSGIPVHITIFSNIPPHPGSPDTLTSTLKSVDELLPSLYKATFAGSAAGQLLSCTSSPSFPNLSDLEVRAVKVTPWKEILECVSARSELATIQGRKFKALRSISLPRRPIDEEAHERLSTLVESIVYRG